VQIFKPPKEEYEINLFDQTKASTRKENGEGSITKGK
jgi:hypothetical protein